MFGTYLVTLAGAVGVAVFVALIGNWMELSGAVSGGLGGAAGGVVAGILANRGSKK